MKKNNKKLGFLLNPLVEAQRNFGVIENRLFYIGLQDVNPHVSKKDKFYDEEFPDTVISPAELKKMFGHGQYLAEIKKACKKLIGTSIEINYEGGFAYYTVFQRIRYDNNGLSLKFNEDMKPFILNIYEHYKIYGFTKFEMQQVFILNSAYAMRLLELLLQYRGTKKEGIITRKIDIDDLRKMLSVPIDAYKKMKDLRKKVLDLPIAEIEKKTKYTITYTTIKEGRRVASIEFKLNCNAVKSDSEYQETVDAQATVESIETQLENKGQTRLFDSATNEPPAPAVTGLTEEQEELIDRLISRGVSAERSKKIVAEYPPDVIKSNLKYAVRQKDMAKNLPGLIIKFIEEDVAGKQEKAKKEAKEKEAKRQRERRQSYGIVDGKIEEESASKIDLENISPDFQKYLCKKGGKKNESDDKGKQQ